ncbi:BgTH12-07360, partial [Blumeria graminis f. sp. triticale]
LPGYSRRRDIFANTNELRKNQQAILFNKTTWAAKVTNGNNDRTNFTIRGPLARLTPPQGQSHEDKRVMTRLDRDHEARKAGPFSLHQKLQRIIPDPSLVVDA